MQALNGSKQGAVVYAPARRFQAGLQHLPWIQDPPLQWGRYVNHTHFNSHRAYT
jgi:hypothetical protein